MVMKKAAESSGTSLTAYGGPGIKLWRRKLRGRTSETEGTMLNSRVTFASYAIDEKAILSKSSLLLKLQVPQVNRQVCRRGDDKMSTFTIICD